MLEYKLSIFGKVPHCGVLENSKTCFEFITTIIADEFSKFPHVKVEVIDNQYGAPPPKINSDVLLFIGYEDEWQRLRSCGF
jgi:hypothetical protein